MSISIETAQPSRVVEDFDFFTIGGGVPATVTVDPTAGDTYEVHPDRYEFNLVAQTSPLDPEIFLPAEARTILLRNVFDIRRRKRTVTEATPEQKAELKRWIQDIVRKQSQGIK